MRRTACNEENFNVQGIFEGLQPLGPSPLTWQLLYKSSKQFWTTKGLFYKTHPFICFSSCKLEKPLQAAIRDCKSAEKETDIECRKAENVTAQSDQASK